MFSYKAPQKRVDTRLRTSRSRSRRKRRQVRPTSVIHPKPFLRSQLVIVAAASSALPPFLRPLCRLLRLPLLLLPLSLGATQRPDASSPDTVLAGAACFGGVSLPQPLPSSGVAILLPPSLFPPSGVSPSLRRLGIRPRLHLFRLAARSCFLHEINAPLPMKPSSSTLPRGERTTRPRGSPTLSGTYTAAPPHPSQMVNR